MVLYFKTKLLAVPQAWYIGKFFFSVQQLYRSGMYQADLSAQLEKVFDITVIVCVAEYNVAYQGFWQQQSI